MPAVALSNSIPYMPDNEVHVLAPADSQIDVPDVFGAGENPEMVIGREALGGRVNDLGEAERHFPLVEGHRWRGHENEGLVHRVHEITVATKFVK